jgi:SOS-response transcriptional repressor LexA
VWKYYEDGTREHEKIELIPLNKEYDTIELDGEAEYKTVGVLKCVL